MGPAGIFALLHRAAKLQSLRSTASKNAVLALPAGGFVKDLEHLDAFPSVLRRNTIDLDSGRSPNIIKHPSKHQ